MAKLTEIQNPISGAKGNLFDVSFLMQNILGVVAFLGIFAVGEKLFGTVVGKTGGLVGQPENPFQPQPQPLQAPVQPQGLNIL